MNFEAVPCMFKQTVDGNESSYVGLLIRPSTQPSGSSNPPPPAVGSTTAPIAAPTSLQASTFHQSPIVTAQPQNSGVGPSPVAMLPSSSTGTPAGTSFASQGRRPIQAAATPAVIANGYINTTTAATNNTFYPQKQLQPRPGNLQQHQDQQTAPYMQHSQQQACTSVQTGCSEQFHDKRLDKNSASVLNRRSRISTADRESTIADAPCPAATATRAAIPVEQLGVRRRRMLLMGLRLPHQLQRKSVASKWKWQRGSFRAVVHADDPDHSSELSCESVECSATYKFPAGLFYEATELQKPGAPGSFHFSGFTTDLITCRCLPHKSPFPVEQRNPHRGLPPISSITHRQSPLECSSTAGPSSAPVLQYNNQNNSQTNGYNSYPQSTSQQSQNYYGQQQTYHQSPVFQQQLSQQQRQHQRIHQPPQYPQMPPPQQQMPQHYPQQISSNTDFVRYPTSSNHPQQQWISPLPANSSATPDSGIQSIGDSPHSTNPYTPPIVSPYTQQMLSVEEREKANHRPPSLDSSEYADMPKLVPMNQMEEVSEEDDFESGPPNISGMPNCTQASPLVDQTSPSVSTPGPTKCGSVGPAVEIHAGMDTKEITQQLVLTFGEQRIKEMAEMLQSKANGAPGFPESATPAPDSTTNGECEDLCEEGFSPAPSLDDYCYYASEIKPKVEDFYRPVFDENTLKEKEKAAARLRLREHRKNVRERIRKAFDGYVSEIVEEWANFSLGKPTPREKSVFAPLDWSAVDSRVREKQAEQENMARRKRKSLQVAEKSGEKKAKVGRKRKIEIKEEEKDEVDEKFQQAPFTVQSTSGKKNPTERRASMISKKSRPATERLPGHDYQKIRSNAIVDVPARINDSEPCECDSSCFCSPAAKCFHRERKIECTPSNCTLHNVCQNRRIYNNQTITDLVKSAKPDESMCLRTGVDIHRGEYVCEYVGEVISRNRFESRFNSEYSSWRYHYAMELCPGFVVDAYKRGSTSRFINHSCEPNCVAQTWLVNGVHRLCIFATRDIQAGDELTIDYVGVHCSLVAPPEKCRCGARKCRVEFCRRPKK
ncbi:hypothetical protein L596_007891 [Steinernema carpocapsae]|uniref:Histone-lysine N-methyltransferase n=1 Tax=Steinernema carpocapsae TaxID=34508 RepID=A0A4U5PBC0_STECR|nr:hypothetical protein L596_007891 [Steinernema carpocapsae]